MRLKSRESQIPEGFVFYEPSTRWRSTPWASFSTIVQEVIAHRRGNPQLTTKFGKSIDQATVENEVDAFNANICAQMGWTKYIIASEGAPPVAPKSSALSAAEASQLAAAGAKVKMIWAGIKTLAEWLDSGTPAVAPELAESRAATCAACPLNGSGDLGQWFVTPTANAIKKQVERLQERKLTTSNDEKLNICTACLCPLKLKVHAPIEIIKNHSVDSALDKMRTAPACWVIAEIAKA